MSGKGMKQKNVCCAKRSGQINEITTVHKIYMLHIAEKTLFHFLVEIYTDILIYTTRQDHTSYSHIVTLMLFGFYCIFWFFLIIITGTLLPDYSAMDDRVIILVGSG
jgi:hypothetical protein